MQKPSRARPTRVMIGFKATFALLVTVGIVFASALIALAQPTKNQSQATTRIRLQPRFVPGEVMRYEIEFQIETGTKNGGAVQDPEGPRQQIVTWDATVRLEVLPASASVTAPPVAAGSRISAPAGIRVRTTYEKSSASVRSDTPDPEAENIEKNYAQLQGASFEFNLGKDGRVSGVTGLASLITDEKARAAAQQWLTQLSGIGSFPSGGIVPGQHWTSEQPADSIPIAGLAWRTDSTYLRNEPCGSNSSEANGRAGAGDCAVILTGLSLDARHAAKNPTPEEYRHNGLRTSGHWTGSGRSLNYVSLRTGWLVSSTQDATQDMDIAILRPGENELRYTGNMRTHSTVSLAMPDLAPNDAAGADALPKR